MIETKKNFDASSKTLDASAKTLDASSKTLDASSKTLDASSKTLDASAKTLDTAVKLEELIAEYTRRPASPDGDQLLRREVDNLLRNGDATLLLIHRNRILMWLGSLGYTLIKMGGMTRAAHLTDKIVQEKLGTLED